VVDRQAFGRFLKLLCSERLRGVGKGLSLTQLAIRAGESKYSFSRSKLDRILSGQSPVAEEDLPKLAELCEVEPMALYDFLLPDFHSAIAVHGQDDMDKVKAPFLPEGVTYWLPRRRLAHSETMIALLTLEPNRGTKANRHPGQEILVLLEGQVRVRLGADDWLLEKGFCAHYESNAEHTAWNVGKETAKLLCIKIIC
jgi:quercetin dioxygenase-like cupin family protein